jgi:subtilisin family serine protease
VLAVGSVAPDGSLSAFSNRGPGPVDVAVPGEDQTTIGNGGRRVTDSGTSEGAAATAGTMARLAAARPASSATQLAHALRQGARRTRGLIGHITFGQVDVAGSLARLGVVRAGAARVSLHLRALTARRSRRATVVRWHASGPVDEILRFRVRVGRRVLTLSAGRSGRRSWALRLHSRPGRVTVVALGAAGRPLAKLVGRVRPA